MHRSTPAALAALLLLATPALAATPRPRATTLGNGLRIIVQEDPSAPVVALAMTYRVGSRNERDGLRGLARLSGHLLSTGPDASDPGGIATALEPMGARHGASTYEDFTVFHALIPKAGLPHVLAMEAVRMDASRLSEAALAAGREAVKAEYHLRIRDRPLAALHEALLRGAYARHPYASTPAGALDDLDRVTLADCLDFHRTYYAPNNAVLVAVGDTTLEEVAALARKTLGPLKRQRSPPPVTAVEPPQRERRTITVPRDAKLPILMGGFHVPPANHPDAPALAILASILFEGEGSRLHRSLVREQRVAPLASGFLQLLRDPGLLVLYVGYLPPRTAAEVETALLRELVEVREDGVLDEEVRTAKDQAIARLAVEQRSPTERALRLARAEIVEGSHTRWLGEQRRLERVTAAQVQRVAQRYLVEANLTLAVLQAAAEEP